MSSFPSSINWMKTQPLPIEKKSTILIKGWFVALGKVRVLSYVTEVITCETTVPVGNHSTNYIQKLQTNLRFVETNWVEFHWSNEAHQFSFLVGERIFINCSYFGLDWFIGFETNFMVKTFWGNKHEKGHCRSWFKILFISNIKKLFD